MMAIVLVLAALVAAVFGKPLQTPRIPLLSNLKAPLYAELDVSDMDIKIQEFIESQVEIQVNRTLQQDIEKLIEAEIDMKIKEIYSPKVNNVTVSVRNVTKINSPKVNNVTEPDTNVTKLSDGKDKDFVVIFHQGYKSGFSSYVPKILTSSTKTAHLSVYNFANNKNISVTMDEDHFEHTLDKNVLMKDGISPAGLHIHSDVSINLYGFLFEQSSAVSEGFLVIPTRFASTSFIIPSYTNFISKSIVAITPLQERTIINIKLRMKGKLTYKSVQYSNNDVITTVLNKYNTLQLSSTSDMSGTMVTASKPVVVVSGNTLGRTLNKNIPGSSVQPFMEMVLPTDQLDNLYIIPQILTRSNNTVRIQAVNSTILKTKIGNQNITKNLNARDHFDFYHTTISYIKSSEDILVMIYPHELSDQKGDSFMMTIHGVHQYLPEYDFAVPTGFDSFISVTVTTDDVNGFILDGKNINIHSIYSISEGLDHFSTFSMYITSGVHRIEHSRKVRFGLWVYGNHKPLDAYGYPAGIAFRTHG